MISKTSFFNKAIYKSTLKRFLWGSVLYFAILFVYIILNAVPANEYYNYNSIYNANVPLLLSPSHLIFPILLSIVVPNVVSILSFRFIHSKKQVVFIHSCPVSRCANYISTTLAGFTLMIVPLIAISLISLCYFNFSDCMIWLGINAFVIFIMFSVSVFSSVITGNSFAAIIITVIIHSFIPIIAASFELIAESFLWGFSSNQELWNFISDNNFVVVSFGIANNYFREYFGLWDYAKFTLASSIIYLLSGLIYIKRRSETASDVAGFKVLNSVFKYVIVFIISLIPFAVFFGLIENSPTAFIAILLIFSIISYFGIEMILKKTVSVFKSYKGYLVFCIFFGTVISFFAFTSFFGYETRIPAENDISEIAVYDYYQLDKEPFTDNETIIKDGLKLHHKLAYETIVPVHDDYNTRIHIKYKLKNGKTFSRAYRVNLGQSQEFISELYDNPEYKKLNRVEFLDNDQIIKIGFDGNGVHLGVIEEKVEFLEAIRSDILNMTYDEINTYDNNIDYYVEITFVCEDTDDVNLRTTYIPLKTTHTNTMEWLRNYGYISENQDAISELAD
ncbi:MAG: hypothetical protein IKV88_07545 [Clostridia bacterium]|nr:hypothetical protein [Clostridia bacterium]